MDVLSPSLFKSLSTGAQSEAADWLLAHGVNPDHTLACWTSTLASATGDEHLHAVVYDLTPDHRRRQVHGEQAVWTKEVIVRLRRPPPASVLAELRLVRGLVNDLGKNGHFLHK